MDLFLAHCIILIWTSLAAVRPVVRPVPERLLAAALIAWGNIVATGLLLSCLHRLGEARWFLGTSVILAVLTNLMFRRFHAAPSVGSTPDRADGATANPWLVGAFAVGLGFLGYAGVELASNAVSTDPDTLAWRLPRVLYYIGQNSLGHFDAADPRQLFLPFNCTLLQLFALVYDAPIVTLNFLSLAAWGLVGLAGYRLCRLISLNANLALVVGWLVLEVSYLLAPDALLALDLPAFAAGLAALVFVLRWRASRSTHDAVLAGLAAGLAGGSTLPLLLVFALVGGVAVTVLAVRERSFAFLRPWFLPSLLALLLALPFAAINLTEAGRWAYSPRSVRDVSPADLTDVPALLPFRLKDQPLINVDTDGADEGVFSLMILGEHQRFTSRRHADPGYYQLLSRARSSRDAAYPNEAGTPVYALIPIPGKRTGGVEYLAAVGHGAAARDYFGLAPHAGQTEPIVGDRCVLVTLRAEPGRPKQDAKTVISLRGLNLEDHARLAISIESTGGKMIPLITFEHDGDAAISIARPVRRIALQIIDQESGTELVAKMLPDRTRLDADPVTSDQPSNVRSIFVTDLVLSKKMGFISVAGLLPVEGPFPQWNLPVLRWAREPDVRISFPPIEQLSLLQLSFSVRLHVRKKAALDVFFNGRLIQHYRIEDSTAWVNQSLTLTPGSGGNVLEFRDGEINPEPDWAGYLELNPDVKAYARTLAAPLEQTARDHYETHGRAEGRTLPTIDKPEPAPDGYYFMFRSIRLEGLKSS